MSDASLEERLAAVERALTEEGGDTPALTDSHEDLDDRVEILDENVAELEAAVEALRGYVGNVKHVNDDVEKRADAAMAKAEAVERALTDDEDDWEAGSNADDPGERASSRPSDDAGGAGTNSGCERFGGKHNNEVRSRSEERETGSMHGTRSVRDTGHETESATDGSNRAPRSPTEYEESRLSCEGSDGDHRRPSDAGCGRIGHRRLDGPDEPGGLLARLREVL